MSDKFLDRAYNIRDPNAIHQLYDAWAASYEAEVGENGYAAPARCAAALSRFVDDKDQPVLDFGCGTGLSGLALRMAGFNVIDGYDVSSEMLVQAQSKMIYRHLEKIEPGAELTHEPGKYAAIAAIGVIGRGAAPISVFDILMHGLGKGGKLVFTFNDHALEDKANEGRLNEWTDCGAAHLLYRDYGPHMPGINLNSNVYVVEKA
ncbi:class I SAM-dependent DNA methyltransferase [Sulfitobacter aestuarii]|uniref:Class I SAM-dependent DNA methyltransferase n=1 Tax=Sulfitobacter aestuarii TaxID=2161676 RepID=A0ABW5U1K7_9RHOB